MPTTPESTAAYVTGFRLMTETEIAAADAAPHPSDFECHCDEPERIFDMEIVEGSVSLTCQNCGKAHAHDDVIELQTAAPIPVRVAFVPEHPSLGGWHGMNRCDCGWWFEIEAVNGPLLTDVEGES